MCRLASALVALIALTPPAAADTINLLCGFYYVIIDTAEKSIAIKSPTLDPAIGDYLEVAFKDGRREQINDQGLPREYREYVRISDDTIDFGKTTAEQGGVPVSFCPHRPPDRACRRQRGQRQHLRFIARQAIVFTSVGNYAQVAKLKPVPVPAGVR